MPLIIKREPRTAQYYTERLQTAEIANGTLSITLDMILVPGGSFLMGSPDDEPDRSDSESPQPLVSLPSFFMSRYPINQAQWAAVAALPKVDRDLEPDPSHFKGENCPVESVSWHDATEFCRRLAQATSRPYRLPTEAEWEYACRAGTTTPFYFGTTITTDLANYYGKSVYNGGSEGEYRQETTPVNHFGIANAFGLCDMHGNVWEWCQDHWHENYAGAPADGSAWINADSDEDAARVLRGGSWDGNPRYCRSASRVNYEAGERDSDYGFRVVCFAPRTL